MPERPTDSTCSVSAGVVALAIVVRFGGRIIVAGLNEMHSSAIPSLIALFLVTSQLELVTVTRETGRDWHRLHPSRRGSAETERNYLVSVDDTCHLPQNHSSFIQTRRTIAQSEKQITCIIGTVIELHTHCTGMFIPVGGSSYG